jgi:cell division septation protein DedD
MNPKVLVVLLFLITFTISFVIYLLVVNIITPHIDLTSTARDQIEVAPELDDSMFGKKGRKVPDAVEGQLQEMYQSDIDALLQDDGGSMEVVEKTSEGNVAGEMDTSDAHGISAPGDVSGGSLDNRLDETVSESLEETYEVTSTDSETTADIDKNRKDRDAGLPENQNASTDTMPVVQESPKSVNRVMVGSYTSIDDAKKAYDKMLDSDMTLAPIIKEHKGQYTLQVGAFSDKQHAQRLVNDLNNKNYSAKIISE